MSSTQPQPAANQTSTALNSDFIRLTTKPTAQLCYDFVPPSGPITSGPLLVVFLNGLGLPKAAWHPAITGLMELQHHQRPAMLAYDRYGQGMSTDRDPSDDGAEDPKHGHDCMSVMRDLRQLIAQIAEEKMEVKDVNRVKLTFVCNSIGCALARLYAQEYPGTVAGMLLLDSILANSDFVSICPDPDAEGFDERSLPEGMTSDIVREAREWNRQNLHPNVGSKEGLSRKNLRALLPDSDFPVLKGPGGRGPYVTVVGHDFITFAEQAQQMGNSKSIALNFTNPYWQKYNEGLAKITEPERSRGPLQAPGCGHFVQRDSPEFVVQELAELLSKILSE